MKIVLLGAGGYHPNSHRQTTCLMIPQRGILLDAGTAAFRVPQYLETEQLDLFLTHSHLDHVIGLTFLLGLFPAERQATDSGDDPSHLRLHAVAEKLAAIREHLYSQHLFPVEPNWTAVPLAGDTGQQPLAGGGTVCWFPLTHPGGSIGYRFDGLDPSDPRKSFAFVTDTTASSDAAYKQPLQGVDLLIHEAYFTDDYQDFAAKTGHSCVGQVAQLAADVGASRLVLTHMNPKIDEREPFDLTAARSLFPAIEFGQDEMEIEF